MEVIFMLNSIFFKDYSDKEQVFSDSILPDALNILYEISSLAFHAVALSEADLAMLVILVVKF
jgi:hypothetical protein